MPTPIQPDDSPIFTQLEFGHSMARMNEELDVLLPTPDLDPIADPALSDDPLVRSLWARLTGGRS